MIKGTKMTYREAVKMFKESYPNKKDKPDYNFAWGVFIDGLCRDGTITKKQYENWQCP